MTSTELIYALVGGAGGGLVVELFRFIILRSEKRETARNILNKNLDPILKAADDLVGKLFSLQRQDFLNLLVEPTPPLVRNGTEVNNLCYYFANFWGRIQILRQDSIYVNLNSTRTGKKLQSFLTMLETKDIQILDRALQRGIGESILVRNSNQLMTLDYFEFLEKYIETETLQKWLESLRGFINNLRDSRLKQRILIYGTVVHALLDTLDYKRFYTRERRAWPNKLTKKSRKELKFQVFGKYLNFVENPKKYFEL